MLKAKPKFIALGLLAIGVVSVGGVGLANAATATDPTTIVVKASDDTYATALDPTGTRGPTDLLKVTGPAQRITLLKFNISGLPAGATIDSADLTLMGATTTKNTNVRAQSLYDTTWDGNKVTWKNMPAAGTVLSNVTSVTAGKTSTWDVSSKFDGKSNGTYALALQIPYIASDAAFLSSEAGAANAPALHITYKTSGGTTVTTKAPTPTTVKAPTPTTVKAPTPTTAKPPVTTPPTTTPPVTAPTSPVGNLETIAAAAKGKTANLGTGTYTMSDFSVGNVQGAVFNNASVIGAGEDKTVFQMKANTSTKAKSVPTAVGSTVNPLYLMSVYGASNNTVTGFTLQGTSQGHLYNGIMIGQSTNTKVSNIKVRSIPGNDHVNPGETFGINDYRNTNASFSNIYEDGTGVGASGYGCNFSTGTSIKNSVFTNNPYSLGITFYKCSGMSTTDVTTTNGHGGVNFEMDSGSATLTRPVFGGNSSADISMGSTTDSVKLTIVDPVYTGKLRIMIWNKYGTNANAQKKSDVKVIVGGVDKTSSVVQFLN